MTVENQGASIFTKSLYNIKRNGIAVSLASLTYKPTKAKHFLFNFNKARFTKIGAIYHYYHSKAPIVAYQPFLTLTIFRSKNAFGRVQNFPFGKKLIIWANEARAVNILVWFGPPSKTKEPKRLKDEVITIHRNDLLLFLGSTLLSL